MVVDIHYRRIRDFYKDMSKKDRFLLFLILLILYRKPRSLYQIIKRTKDRAGFSLPPSSVATKLKYLEKKGYIQKGASIIVDGRNQYILYLTEKGRNFVESFAKTVQKLMSP
jgi:DNA-binding PadR family transcriptional regulator